MGTSAGWTAEALATGWLVLQLTDSPFWLGLVAGLRGLTQILLSAVGGAVADRIEIRGFLIRNQRFNCVLSVAVALLVMTGDVQMWQVIAFQIGAGLLTAMNAPANQVLLYETVGTSRLLSMRALSFMVMSVARILSAVVCGSLVQVYGVGPAYLFVASGYLFGSLALLGVEPTASVRHTQGAVRSLVEGLRYAAKTQRVREILALSLVTESFGFSHIQMVPVIARDVLAVGAVGLGYLTAASGAGQLAAMLLLASAGNVRRKDLLLLLSTLGYGASIFFFALSPWFAVSLVLSLGIGAAGGIYDSTISTVLQMLVDRDMRGRVIGLYTATWGSNQLGSFGLGVLATLVGTPAAIASCAALVVLTAMRLFPKRVLLATSLTASDEPPPSAIPAPIGPQL